MVSDELRRTIIKKTRVSDLGSSSRRDRGSRPGSGPTRAGKAGESPRPGPRGCCRRSSTACRSRSRAGRVTLLKLQTGQAQLARLRRLVAIGSPEKAPRRKAPRLVGESPARWTVEKATLRTAPQLLAPARARPVERGVARCPRPRCTGVRVRVCEEWGGDPSERREVRPCKRSRLSRTTRSCLATPCRASRTVRPLRPTPEAPGNGTEREQAHPAWPPLLRPTTRTITAVTLRAHLRQLTPWALAESPRGMTGPGRV